MKIIELLKKIAFMAVMVGSLSLLGCGEEEAGHEDHGDHKKEPAKAPEKKAAPAPEKKKAAPAPAKAPEKKPASTEKPK